MAIQLLARIDYCYENFAQLVTTNCYSHLTNRLILKDSSFLFVSVSWFEMDQTELNKTGSNGMNSLNFGIEPGTEFRIENRIKVPYYFFETGGQFLITFQIDYEERRLL